MEWEREKVKKELIDEFGKEFEDEIEETLSLDEGRYADWGDAGSVTIDGIEYNIIADEDEAERIAIDLVKQELEEPETFNLEWLKDFVYITDTDKGIFIAEEESTIRSDVEDEAEEKFEDKYEELEEIEDEEERAEAEKDLDKEKNEWIEEKVQERLEYFESQLDDPVGYFVDEAGIYTIEELLKQPWIRIDIEKAAEEAVSTDGWAHFLSLYDGNYHTTKNGLVYFRE